MRQYRLVATFLLLFFSASAASALTASFTSDFSSGCAPLLVNFHNTTSPTSGTTYSWDLGNGTPPVPTTDASTTYLTVGTYTVTLTARNGSSTSTYTMVITVYPSPTVSFAAIDTTVCPGSTVTFNNTSSSGVPGPMTYLWSFGDGGTSTAASPSHVYSAPGNYNVTLSVTNSQGCVSTLVKTAYIHVYNPPASNFTASPVTNCHPPAHVTFTGPGGAGSTYQWTFGDGGTGTGPSPTHDYATPGSYTVKLVVTDANGCKDSTTRVNYIYVGDMNAEFTLPVSACVFSVVNFPNTSSAHTSRTWYYGDGGSNGPYNGSHAYSAPGTYTVTLVISDGLCTDTVTHTIVINPGPAVDFTISPTDPCPLPQTLTYTTTGATGSGITWVFEGGSTATGSPASHTYTTYGVKVVSMIAVDPVTGCKDTVKKLDTLYDLEFDAFASPFHGCKPLTVNFSWAAITHQTDGLPHPYPLPLTSFTWDFGDGTPGSTGSTPSHVYTDTGTYYAVVTAITANGCPVSDTIRIDVGQPPQVTFTANPLHICYNKSIDFTAHIVVGPVDMYEWFYGDGGSATDTTGRETYTYTLPGVFTVTVIPYYKGCPGDPFIRTNYITVDSPKAIIGHTYNCNPRTSVSFTDQSLGDDTHIWLFGDGSTSTLDDPTHNYPGPGVYDAVLATYNALSGCRDTAHYTVTIVDLGLSFVADQTSICKYGSVTFTSTVTGGAPDTYFWYVNGVVSTPSSWTSTNVFNTTGSFTIMLVTTDENGCHDTATRTNYILVGRPNTSFSGSPATGCLPLTVTFTDASTPVTGTGVVNHQWFFGDGGTATSTGTSVVHTYTAAGTYTVREITTDNIGCRDTLDRPAYITVNQPIASFNTPNTHPCINGPITFNNTSSGGIVSSSWTFGDGGTSSAPSPSHTYTAVGTYTVTLTVTDGNGCTNTATYPAYINVTKPIAAFSMDDSFTICPPLMVHFTNLSTSASTYYWTFGDATSSTVPSPSDFYTVSGLYPVVLVAYNIYGCTDTARHNVTVYGYAGAFNYTPLQGCAPLLVHFAASLTNVPSLVWDFGDGSTGTVVGSDTISHYYVHAGAYVPKLILSDNTGCQNSSVGADTIKVDEVIPKFTTIPNPICMGGIFNFIDSSTTYWMPITSWTWSYGGITNNTQSPSYQIDVPGTYTVSLTVSTAWGCTGAVSGDMIVYPLPTVTTSQDTIVCVGDPATLYGYGAQTYEWSDGATLSCTACNPTTAIPTAVTAYTVIGTDEHGCKDTAVVNVGQRTLTIAAAWGDTAVCYGTHVQLYDTGGYTYTWLPPLGLNNNTIYNPIASPPYTTVYMVIARIGTCIPDTDRVTVTIYPLPTVDAGPDQRLLAGSNAQLTATGSDIAVYEWSPGMTLSNTTIYNPVASMSVNTTYNVEVTSIHGCKASDTVNIKLYCENSMVFIPNSFTPNGDGQNDVFFPRGIGIKQIQTFRIYNRWGELLFERSAIDLNDESNGWDGTYKGGTPHPDVYVYIMEATCYTGEPVNIKGDVTIIR